MSKTLSRSLRAAFMVAIIGGLVLFARKVDWPLTWKHIAQANFTILVAAALVNLGSLGLKGLRWWMAWPSPRIPSSFRHDDWRHLDGAAIHCRAGPLARHRGDAGVDVRAHRVCRGLQALTRRYRVGAARRIGVALAPEFIFKRHGTRASDSGLELHSRAEELG